MSRPSLSRNKLLGAFRNSLIATVLMLMGTASVVQGMGLRFWDDANTNGGQCDVLGYIGGATKCSDNSYNVALVSTMTTAVPKGSTTVHIVYDNVTLDPVTGLPNGTDNLQFDIQGDAWCPTYTGAPGINRKDSANGGYFADSNNLPTNISTGTEVTDFVMNERDGSERLLAGTGVYRSSVNTTNCDTAGSGYAKMIPVQPSDLRHQAGFPANTWYAELLVRPSKSLTKLNGANFYTSGVPNCVPSTPNSCQGISNKFRIVLNTSEAGASHYHSVSGSSIASTGDDYNVTYTNYTWTWDSSIAQDSTRHYSIVYRFGADCSVLNYGGPKPSHLLMYDIDDSGTGVDVQKALLVRTDSDGNVYTLNGGSQPYGPNAYYQGRSIGTVGTWNQRTDNDPNTALPSTYSQDYNDPNAYRIDELGSNSYLSANFNARVGDTYKFYLYDTRGDLVNQIGAPFDSVYYDNPCTAKLNPGANLSLASGSKYQPGSVVNADATIANQDNTTATADWDRYYWITPVQAAADTSYGAGDTLIQSGLNRRTVGAGNTATSTDGSSFGGTWQYAIPASVQDGSWICTSMHLNPNTLDPSGTQIVGASNPAVDCKRITNTASPYFSSIGGDVAVGAGFGSCTPHVPMSGTSIYGNNAGGPPNPYNGSGSQLAALTLGVIKNFATDKYQNGQTGTIWYDTLTGSTSPLAESGRNLSFANYPSNGQYGSSAGFTSWCAPDYYAAAGAGTSFTSGSGTGSMTQTAGTHNYVAGSSITFAGGSIAVNGENIILKVTGNVYITGNVTYGAPANVAGIPSFELVASGSIFVDPNVTRLDGLYVAQGGSFITCANASGGLSGVTAISTCNKQLTIYGAVAAGIAVVPNRTSGDVAGASGQPEVPSEIFYYNPQMWLGAPSSGGGVEPWQAVTSLPPIL
jgi:hypothetical protein